MAWIEKIDFDYLEDMGTINTPFLFFAGEKDKLAPVENIKQAQTAISGKDNNLIVIPATGHGDLIVGKRVIEKVLIPIDAWFKKLCAA